MKLCGWCPIGSASSMCYVASGESEAVSGTTDSAFQQKLLVSFTATLGVRYVIHTYCEAQSPADEDVEAQVTINTVEQMFMHFKNQPYSTRWAQMNGAIYQSNALNGNQDVKINWRNGYGTGTKNIRRARIFVMRCS